MTSQARAGEQDILHRLSQGRTKERSQDNREQDRITANAVEHTPVTCPSPSYQHLLSYTGQTLLARPARSCPPRMPLLPRMQLLPLCLPVLLTASALGSPVGFQPAPVAIPAALIPASARYAQCCPCLRQQELSPKIKLTYFLQLWILEQ